MTTSYMDKASRSLIDHTQSSSMTGSAAKRRNDNGTRSGAIASHRFLDFAATQLLYCEEGL